MNDVPEPWVSRETRRERTVTRRRRTGDVLELGAGEEGVQRVAELVEERLHLPVAMFVCLFVCLFVLFL